MYTQKQKHMKVLFLGKYAFDDLAGGIERYSHAFLSHLPVGVKTVNVFFAKGKETSRIVKNGQVTIKVGVWATLASTAISPALVSVLRDVLLQETPDIVFLQCPNPMMHVAYLVASAFCLKKPKLVLYWHSDIVRQKVLLKLYRPFLNRLLAKADVVIVHSEALKKSPQLEVCETSKIYVIPIGVEAPMVDEKVLLNIQLYWSGNRRGLKNTFKLFACGRHVPYKGFDYLLRSLALLPKDVVLTLGGEGQESDALKKLAQELNLKERVHFVGRIPEEKLGAYLQASDVYCFPSISTNEAFGIAQVEAMLLGKPVVGFELFNGTTFVNKHGETGLIVENKNVKAYAQALLKLKDTPELCKRLGEQAKVRSEILFSVQRMVSDTWSLFGTLINSSNVHKENADV